MEPLKDFTPASVTGFIEPAAEYGAMVISYGLASYRGIEDRHHRAKVVEKMAGHVLLPGIHWVVANFKRWALGTFLGVRRDPKDDKFLETRPWRSCGCDRYR